MKIKVAFLGTPTISTFALRSLLEEKNIEIKVIVTNEDKPIGRNQSVLQESEVAKYCRNNNINIPIIKTNSINKNIDELKKYEFDYLITCAFGQFLSEPVLLTPKIKSLNIHASLLPEGRGGAPIHWAIINGKKETGISYMEMVKEMDAGDYYCQDEIKIDENDTYDSLYLKLCELIKQKTASRLLEINDKKLSPIKQDENKLSKWLNIKREDRIINWDKTPIEVVNLVRGLYSNPIAFSIYKNLEIKICEVKITNKIYSNNYKNGTILSITKDGIEVLVNNNQSVVITKLIIPGKKEKNIFEIINGSHIFELNTSFN